MKRHARHGDGLTRRLATHGERDVDQAVGLASVFKEELVEIAHAVEDQGVRVLRFDAQVLLHHGRVGAVIGQGET